MPKRRKRKPKSIPMQVGNDPALWRFDSLQDALEASTGLIAQMVREGEQLNELEEADNEQSPVEESALVSVSAD